MHLRHLLRSAEALDRERLLAHYELIARELRFVVWRSRGPFARGDSVDVLLLPG